MDDLTGSALKKFMEGTGAALRREMHKTNTPLPEPLALLLRRLAVAEVPRLAEKKSVGRQQRINGSNCGMRAGQGSQALSPLRILGESRCARPEFRSSAYAVLQSGKNTEDWRGLRRRAVSHLRREREGVSGPFSARDKAFSQKPAAMDKSSSPGG
jgi:hypothetical protein